MKREEELTASVKAALRAYAEASKLEKCPICDGVESCDHSVKERLSARLSTSNPDIKPLEWEEIGSGFYRAPAPLFGNIRVERYGERFTTCYSVPGYSNTFANGSFATADEAKAGCEGEYQKRIRSALLSTPRPEPVGWETEAEWELEMRCCGITEATPFAEVSKLINDLWQQYCLAAEPKPEAEGVAHEKGWQPIETAPTDGTSILATFWLWNEPEKGRGMEVVSWDGEAWSGDAYPIYPPTHWMPLPSPPALTAKHTDGRDG